LLYVAREIASMVILLGRFRAARRPQMRHNCAVTTLFLLSPARCNGGRAEQLIASQTSELGAKLRAGTAPLGDVFAWLSALYFRGKLAYARRFAAPPPPLPGSLVMVAGLGLMSPDDPISAATVRAMGRIDVESPAFVRPLAAGAALADQRYGATTRVVLLGSIATGKYVDVLAEVFGARLEFPAEFVGRGDMSRGGMMLRAAKTGDELVYVPVLGAARNGPRAAKLSAAGRSPARRAARRA
jgi:hypothetical protein